MSQRVILVGLISSLLMKEAYLFSSLVLSFFGLVPFVVRGIVGVSAFLFLRG
ncbi:hypothetical protein Bca101_019049 [Brassica carinata]